MTSLDYFKDTQHAMVDLLTALIAFETPSADKARVDELIDYLTEKFEALQASSITRFPLENAGDCVLGKWNEDQPGEPILFLMHADTVWPVGTVDRRPVHIDDDGRLYGPGAVDMRASIVLFLSVMQALIDHDELPNRPIWALVNGDEEIGSRYSTPTVQQVAQDCGLVLVMEPGTSDGALKTRRKGLATYRLHVEGRAAHAGNEPEQGVNAIIELAQQAMKLHKLNDLRNGTSVSVTMIEGGTAGNVIPAYASAYIDSRSFTQLDMDRIKAALDDVLPFMPGAQVRVEPLHSRPPMEPTDATRKAYERCREIGATLGITVREESVGGVSDANTTAALGIPTIDGLGPYGGGLHAEQEHVLLSSMPRRAALIAGILKHW